MVAAQVGSQALAVFTIVAVNLLLPYVISYLSEKEKHQTRSAEARSTARVRLLSVAAASCPEAMNWSWGGRFHLLTVSHEQTVM